MTVMLASGNSTVVGDHFNALGFYGGLRIASSTSGECGLTLADVTISRRWWTVEKEMV